MPMSHNYGAWGLESTSRNYWAEVAATTEACVPRAYVPQYKKTLQRGAWVL